MGAVGASFSPNVYSKNMPIVIATNRNSAVLLPVRLRYDADGFAAGTVLARNTTDGWFDKYDDGASSGLNTAACVLFEEHPTEDFDGTGSTGSCMAVGIFGGCTVYKDKLVGYDAAALVDFKGREITDSTGVTLVSF